MTLEEYTKRSLTLSYELDTIPGYREWSRESSAHRRNIISRSVSCKESKAEVGLANEFEEVWYDYLWKEAELHVEMYGYWPTFELEGVD
ncbi:MAG: hypothetical protein IJC88_05425 [Oscillospiraceae bacterium]|nr:hypothetical protein [Oscillospiraceae bacterium]